jgi:hypothetical protein
MIEQILEHNYSAVAYINVILESRFAAFMVADSPIYSGIGAIEPQNLLLYPNLLNHIPYDKCGDLIAVRHNDAEILVR